MSKAAHIQKAIERLPQEDQATLTAWLQSREKPILSNKEEAVLLASLDKAAAELDAGQGVPIETVRERVAKWATK
jgi:predicted transcriptional regulator